MGESIAEATGCTGQGVVSVGLRNRNKDECGISEQPELSGRAVITGIHSRFCFGILHWRHWQILG